MDRCELRAVIATFLGREGKNGRGGDENLFISYQKRGNPGNQRTFSSHPGRKCCHPLRCTAAIATCLGGEGKNKQEGDENLFLSEEEKRGKGKKENQQGGNQLTFFFFPFLWPKSCRSRRSGQGACAKIRDKANAPYFPFYFKLIKSCAMEISRERWATGRAHGVVEAVAMVAMVVMVAIRQVMCLGKGRACTARARVRVRAVMKGEVCVWYHLLLYSTLRYHTYLLISLVPIYLQQKLKPGCCSHK